MEKEGGFGGSGTISVPPLSITIITYHTERQGIIADIYYRRDSKTDDETEEILHESVR